MIMVIIIIMEMFSFSSNYLNIHEEKKGCLANSASFQKDKQLLYWWQIG